MLSRLFERHGRPRTFLSTGFHHVEGVPSGGGGSTIVYDSPTHGWPTIGVVYYSTSKLENGPLLLIVLTGREANNLEWLHDEQGSGDPTSVVVGDDMRLRANAGTNCNDSL